MDPTSTIQVTPGLQRILDTLELFELVLSYLPMKDLLFVQAVCKKWQTIIKSSPTLQEALFFKPRANLPSIAISTLQAGENSPPPLKPTTSPSLSRDDFRRNSLLMSKFPPFFTKIANSYRAPGSDDLLKMPWNQDDQSRAAYARPDASWRRMLLVQPAAAIPAVEVLYVTHGQGGDGLSTADRKIDPLSEGLRMGWVYDRCCELALKPIGSFFLRWHMLKSEQRWAPKLTILLRHTIQCRVGGENPKEWKVMWSEGYVEATIGYRTHEWVEQARMNGPPRRTGYRVPKPILLDEEDFTESGSV